MPRLPARLTLSVPAAVLLLASACSGGGGSAGPATATPNRATPTPVPAAAKTAAALGGNAPLAAYQDVQKRFTMDAPVGWSVETSPGTLTFSLAGNPVAATITVYCQPGFTADQLIQQDVTLNANLGSGRLPAAAAVPATVAGLPAKRIEWSGRLGSAPLPHDAVYFSGGGCGWRIQLTTFAGTDIGQFKDLFGKVLASFRLTAGG